jgi:hypothetical protein
VKQQGGSVQVHVFEFREEQRAARKHVDIHHLAAQLRRYRTLLHWADSPGDSDPAGEDSVVR